MMRNVSV